MSKPKTRQDHIREWQRRKDKERRREESHRKAADPGESWSVHRAPRHVPRLGAEFATQRRQAEMKAYREATGQEPFDVTRSWPSSAALDSDLELGSRGDRVITDLRLYWMSGQKDGVADRDLKPDNMEKP